MWGFVFLIVKTPNSSRSKFTRTANILQNLRLSTLFCWSILNYYSVKVFSTSTSWSYTVYLEMKILHMVIFFLSSLIQLHILYVYFCRMDDVNYTSHLFSIIVLSKNVPHIGRLVANRIVWTTKLAAVSNSLVRWFHVVIHRRFSVRFKRALVTGEDVFFMDGLFVNFHAPLVLEDLFTLITLVVLLLWMFEPFVFNHISFPGEFFVASLTNFFYTFCVNGDHVSLQFVFAWQNLPTVWTHIVIDTRVLKSNVSP